MDHLDLISEILAGRGVHIHASLLRSIPSSPSNNNSTTTTSKETILQLWKANHDLCIVALFINAKADLQQSDIRLSWKEFARRGPNAVRFEMIKSYVQVQLYHFGYPLYHQLSNNSSAHDLLCSLIWLIAKCELVEKYVSNLCRKILNETPFVAPRGHRSWSVHESTSSILNDDLEKSIKPSSNKKTTVKDLTHRVASQCGALWHAMREMAAAENQRTLLLQRICEKQVQFRPSSKSRLLLPIEVDVALVEKNDDNAVQNKKVHLDNKIKSMKELVNINERAVLFWQWCCTVADCNDTVADHSDSIDGTTLRTDGMNNDSNDTSAHNDNSDNVIETIENFIVNELGLVLRKP
jgi:hypothetical protein